MVHTDNEMRQLKSIIATQPIQIEVKVMQEPTQANGKLYVSLIVTFSQAGEFKLSCTSRYMGKRGKSKSHHPPRSEQSAEYSQPLSSWQMPANLGRSYAKLSGDYNPIHLWPWSAKALGFKQPIAHGMYAVAKAQATIENHSGMPITQMTATFIQPLSLPGKAQLAVADMSYRIFSGSSLNATGTYSH
jgi:MaoC like domain